MKPNKIDKAFGFAIGMKRKQLRKIEYTCFAAKWKFV